MSQLLIDRISNLSVHNGILRIECVMMGADGKPQPSGTLVIPGIAARGVLNTLVGGVQELDRRLHEQRTEATEAAPESGA